MDSTKEPPDDSKIYLITLLPEHTHATHYSYLFQNITLTNIWDYGDNAGAISASTANTNNNPVKSVTNPLDSDGNSVEPGLTID